jgi:hypothetical protein
LQCCGRLLVELRSVRPTDQQNDGVLVEVHDALRRGELQSERGADAV